MLRRTFTRSLLGSLAVLPFQGFGQNRRKMFLDSDTANEIDDLYAIVRAVLDPSFQVVGLGAAQWHTNISPPDTMLQSQKLNTDLLRLMGREDIPAPQGSELAMGMPWGGEEPRDSPAAQLMIRQARAMPASQKLLIVSTGAVTNVASAVKLAPDIVPKIACYSMGARFYADRNLWNKDEFNVRNDLNAANFLLNQPGLEVHIMPANVCGKLVFDQADTLGRLQGKGRVWDYLAARWLSVAPESKSWIMWDLALIEALARPGLAKEAAFKTPPENEQRDVFVYTDIDASAMRADWWKVSQAHA